MPAAGDFDERVEDAELLLQAYRPLIYSVCRRYLRYTEDVEDAAQETFLRLLRRHDELPGPTMSWVMATARSCSVNLIRRATREQRRRQQLANTSASCDGEQMLIWDAIRLKLGDALLAIEDASRQLLINRFYRKAPLGEIALSEGKSVSTMSRRVSAAVNELALVLQEMGLAGVDQGSVADFLGDAGVIANPVGEEELRFAPDWRAAALSPALQAAHGTMLPGWQRPLRIGAFVSQSSMLAKAPWGTFAGCHHDPDVPLESTVWLRACGFEMVSIVESGTTGVGQVERLLRNHELTAGLVDSSDVEALKTLDVILLGFNWSIDAKTTRAFSEAVKSGVGLLNEYWTGNAFQREADVHVHELSLSATPVVGFHVAPCGYSGLPATVREESPLLPGLKAGSRFQVVGCGPLYRPIDSARVLISKDMIIDPSQHNAEGIGSVRMPVYITGQLGRGRVAVVNLVAQRSLRQQLNVTPPEYFANLMSWLAEPRREQT